jgi:hypothetical protein
MKFTVLSIALLLCTTLTFSQTEDSTTYEAYDTTNSDYSEDENSAYSSSTYTQNPGDLTPSKKELDQSYTAKKFSKTAWKRIVGETNYTEEPVEEPKGKEANYQPRSVAWNPAILKIVGYVLILLLIAAVIFYLLKNALQDEDVGKKPIQTDTLLYDNQHIDEIAESDIDRLLREALERNDFRSAVRLYYIRLLKHLNSTGHINWKKDKTNREYAQEVSAFSFTREFRKLMIAYEIIWYGERTPSAEEFKKLQGNFNELHHQAVRTA